MALTFEYEKDNTVTGTLPFVSHERDSVIYNYFVENEMALDRSATAPYGYYDDVVFTGDERHLTTRAVTKIGIKNFPGIGGIGFYRDAYSDESLVVAPIHVKRDKYKAPVLTKVEIVDGKLHLVITPPDELKYTCYRLVVRQGTFAFEYITYKTDYIVDAPTVKGTYTCYCIGYDEDNGAVSEYSNELPLTITEGADDWAPHFETIADLEAKVEKLERSVGDIDTILDEINGEEV